jgi:hypothetical protein
MPLSFALARPSKNGLISRCNRYRGHRVNLPPPVLHVLDVVPGDRNMVVAHRSFKESLLKPIAHAFINSVLLCRLLRTHRFDHQETFLSDIVFTVQEILELRVHPDTDVVAPVRFTTRTDDGARDRNTLLHKFEAVLCCREVWSVIDKLP